MLKKQDDFINFDDMCEMSFCTTIYFLLFIEGTLREQQSSLGAMTEENQGRENIYLKTRRSIWGKIALLVTEAAKRYELPNYDLDTDCLYERSDNLHRMISEWIKSIEKGESKE